MENTKRTIRKSPTPEQRAKINAAHKRAEKSDKTIMKLPSELEKKPKAKSKKGWYRTSQYKIARGFRSGAGRYS